jgi:tetratricopeptide (TPR) repeat protein
MGEKAGPGSLLDTLADAPVAAALLRNAALLRRPVDRAGLAAAVARIAEDEDEPGTLDFSVPPGFTEAVLVLQERGLLRRAGDGDDERWDVPGWVLGNLPAGADEYERRAAHARLARYWGWRATHVTQDVEDLVEARHHHLAADEVAEGASLSCAIADLWREAGETARSEPLLVDALGRVEPESAEEAEILYRLGTLRALAGRNLEARALFERCLDIAIDGGDVETVNHAVFALASVADGVGEFEDARGLYERAIPVFEAAGDVEALAACRQALAAMAVRRGDYTEALPAIEAAIAAATDDDQLAEALHQKGMAAHWQGDYAAARRALDEALRAAERSGDEEGRAIIQLELGAVAAETGDLAAARRLLSDARLGLGREDARVAAHGDVLEASIAWLAGELDAVDRAAARALKRADSLGDRTVRAMARDFRGLAARERGELAEALRWFREAQAEGEIAGFRALVATTQVHSAVALDLDGARAEADALLAGAAEIFQAVGHEAALGWCACERAESLTRRGALEAAVAWAERAAQVFRRVASPVGHTTAVLVQGRILAATGEAEDARSLLHAAWDDASRLGLRTIAAEAASALAALDLRGGDAAAALRWQLRALPIWQAQRSRHLAPELSRLAAVRGTLGSEAFAAGLAAHASPELAGRLLAAVQPAPEPAPDTERTSAR